MAGLIYNSIVYICWWRNGENDVKMIQVGHTHIERPDEAGEGRCKLLSDDGGALPRVRVDHGEAGEPKA